MDWSAIIGALAMVGGIVTWSLRLEGRVNVQNQRVDDLKELINERFNGMTSRLERIERKIDNGNGKH